MIHDPHRLREELCAYLSESARSFRDILRREGDRLPRDLRGEIEFLENFCRFAVAGFERVIGRRLVARVRDEYRRTADPICAWSAWRMCRAWDLPVPDTILAYVDAAAARLLAAEAYGGGAALQAATALGLLPRGERPDDGDRDALTNPDGLLGRLASEKLADLLAAAGGRRGQTDPWLGLRRSLYSNVALALALLPDEEDEDSADDEGERKERAVIRYIRDRYAVLKNGA